MRNLPIETLRAFVATADMDSVTAAADQLGRSQPAVSLQIKKLEAALGCTLFIRHSKQLSLSPQGAEAYRGATEILRLNDQLVERFSRPELAGQLRLGIPSEFASTLLPKIIGRFTQAHPHVRLEVFSDLSRNLLSDIQREPYDLILALHDQATTQRRGHIKSDELVWVGSSQQPLERQAALPLILAQDGCLYRKRALQRLEKIRRPWRIVHTNPDLSGIRAAIEAGLGITVLARSTVPRGLQIIDSYSTRDNRRETLPPLGKIAISLRHSQRNTSAAAMRLAEDIQSSL